MKTPALDRIGDLLAELCGPGAFASKRTAEADKLHLEVRGVGPVRLPVTRATAKRLCAVARPARYGQGERTLLDRTVRDTWEVPKSRVKIDRRRWNRTLRPMLDRVRADLGLPEGFRLRAELHSMLVYGPGQFFRPHKDSQKADDMVATLVVTLPSSFRGGALVVEHGGETVTSRGSKQRLSFTTFYADCQHEVRPVTEGFRVSLTYNLRLAAKGTRASPGLAPGHEPDEVTVARLADCLDEHFTTPVRRRHHRPGQNPYRDPPRRLVYLLDHQYTERGLGWQRLKGTDAQRAAALQATANRADCEAALALAEIHECWQCEEDYWDAPRYGRRGYRRWQRDEDDAWYEDDPPPGDDPDGYTLVDLVDWSITLDRWIAPPALKAEAIATRVSDDEVCYATPSRDIEPYASEYEGYMGNYGNTMDRWYRRAAVVLWHRKDAFTVRAEASPSWALLTLKSRIRSGSLDEAREMARSLRPFWSEAVRGETQRDFLGHSMAVAEALDEPELAFALLEPLPIEALTPARAPALAGLLERYGEPWTRALVAAWSAEGHHWMDGRRPDRRTWLDTLPRLIDALVDAGTNEGMAAAELLLDEQWDWLQDRIDGARALLPRDRNGFLMELARPMLAFFEAVATAGASELGEAAVTFLCEEENEFLFPCLIDVLRAAEAREFMTPEAHEAVGLEALRDHLARVLEARLSTPARAEDDWSLDPPGDCTCELCGTLADFLAAPDRIRLEWPLAKQRRRHIHEALDSHGLPIRHETRRSGSPHTLILTKKAELFERAAAERRTWQDDLEWLRA